jgi:SAM-dependent methyltransferase
MVVGRDERFAPAPDRASGMERYYELRAPEYDATTYELAGDDPLKAKDLMALEALVAGIPPTRVLDVGCGTAWLSRHLRGQVVLLDASESMLRLARERIPNATFVRATVPPLPFPDESFDIVFTSHVYNHFQDERKREAFVREAFRVANELLVIEQPWEPGLPSEAWEERTLGDGSVHAVYKRYLPAETLAEELEGEVVLENRTFIAVRAVRLPPI